MQGSALQHGRAFLPAQSCLKMLILLPKMMVAKVRYGQSPPTCNPPSAYRLVTSKCEQQACWLSMKSLMASRPGVG